MRRYWMLGRRVGGINLRFKEREGGNWRELWDDIFVCESCEYQRLRGFLSGIM